MEKITLHNYEAYLLDHSEGKLNEVQLGLLFEFLSAHPELEIDLQDLYLPRLTDVSGEAEFKDTLKQNKTFNTEHFLLDYLEGQLNAVQENKARSILASDKDLVREFQLYQLTRLQPDENINLFAKHTLYKQEDDSYLNNAFIAYIENDLSGPERVEFEQSVQGNHEKKNELALYKKTVLPVNAEIVFENKQALKRDTRLIVWYQQKHWVSAAAALFLIISSVLLFKFVLNADNSLHPLKEQARSQSPVKQPESTTQQSKLLTASNTSIPQQEKQRSRNKHTPYVTASKEKNQSLLNPQIAPDSIQVVSSDAILAQVATHTNTEQVFNELSEANKKQISLAIDSELTKLTALQEVEDEEEEVQVQNLLHKNSFWKKAVKIAQQANNLGLRSLNGVQKKNDHYLLSFHSLSIEKK